MTGLSLFFVLLGIIAFLISPNSVNFWGFFLSVALILACMKNERGE